MKDKYAQLLNADQQPFFVDMNSGKAYWLIDESNFPELQYMAHSSENGKCYYENLETQEVTWSIPYSEMSPAAINTAKVLQEFNGEDTAEWIGLEFPEDLSENLMIAIDDYLLGGEEEEEEDVNKVENLDDLDIPAETEDGTPAEDSDKYDEEEAEEQEERVNELKNISQSAVNDLAADSKVDNNQDQYSDSDKGEGKEEEENEGARDAAGSPEASSADSGFESESENEREGSSPVQNVYQKHNSDKTDENDRADPQAQDDTLTAESILAKATIKVRSFFANYRPCKILK
jgi:hypothetical protein